MKTKLFLSSLVFAVAAAAYGQTPVAYTNDLFFIAPPLPEPQIDALYFVNNSYFEVVYTNINENAQLFTTTDTDHFINTGFLSLVPGLDFEWFPSRVGQRRPSFEIINTGTIEIGTATNVFALTSNNVVSLAYPKAIMSATNIINPGAISVGYNGVFSLSGQNIDLSRGSIQMTNAGVTFINLGLGVFGFLNNANNGSIFDGYWGMGTNYFNPYFQFVIPPPMSPGEIVTERGNNLAFNQLILTNALSYGADFPLWQYPGLGSNDIRHVVYVSNTNSSYAPKVYIYMNAVVLEWAESITNSADGTVQTSYLYVEDFLTDFPGLGLMIDGYAGVGITRPTFIPINYSVFQTTVQQTDIAALVGSMTIPATYVPNVYSTNTWTAYEALLPPINIITSDTVGADVTNSPGRIEMNGFGALNLELAHVTSQNYLSLVATNQFMGSAGAQISAPFLDVNLRSTNGLLSITNLLRPSVIQPEGYINLYSTCQTNVTGTITNIYHQILVDAHISPTVESRVEDVTLRVTNTLEGDDNLVINDVLNITRGFLFDASRITIATNEPGSPTTSGSINLESSAVFWSTATPRLQFLTNNGSISSQNTIFFGGSRSTPYYGSSYQEPYQAFVNTGTINDIGTFIWAKEFLNGGPITSSLADIQLDQSQTAIITNTVLQALQGAISLKAGYLLASSNTFSANSLVLSPTNVISDGVTNLAPQVPPVQGSWPTNGNTWLIGAGGINMTIAPKAGDLLGTTITNTAPANGVVSIVWGGTNRGNTVKGFTNNAALGRLVLVGGDKHSVFKFSPPQGMASGAIYVDCLELAGAASTNRDNDNNYLGVQIAPNMKVYYGQAFANGYSIAEKLNGRNRNGTGGGFYWVSNYNDGYYSSTNLTYPSGITYRVNAALAASTDISSSGNGQVNSVNPAPIPPSLLAANKVTNSIPALPLIVQQPVPQITSVGASNQFSVVTGPGKVSYQWMYRAPATNVAAPILNATNSSYTLKSVQWTNRGTYSVVVANAFGRVVSADATLTVETVPTITTQPANQVVLTNTTATFQVAAFGSLPLFYQWNFNGTPIANAAASTFKLTGAKAANAGAYTVVISNSVGVTTSQVASLTVVTTPSLVPLPHSVPAPGNTLSSASPTTNNFAGAVGTFNGLISDPALVSANSSGALNVQVTKTGSYSGKVTLGGSTYSVSGSLNTQSAPISRGSSLSPLTLFLQADPVTAGGMVFGQVSAVGWTAQVVAFRAAYSSSKTACPYAGSYTLIMPPDSTNLKGPGGYSSGSAKVDTSGNVQFSGVLADGTAISQTTTLSTNGYWPLFASARSGGEFAIGWMQYTNGPQPSVGAAAGNSFLWVKVAGADAASYTGGFTNGSTVRGSSFTAQRTGIPLVGQSPGNLFELILSGGGISPPLTNYFVLGSNNSVPSIPGVSLSFSASSGVFSGSRSTATGYKAVFGGAVSQTAGNGFGYCLGSSSNANSGVVMLLPAH